MIQVIVAGVISFLVSIFVTPLLIRYFHRREIGQEIREDGPQSHARKRGTPTMGGIAILLAITLGYLASSIVALATNLSLIHISEPTRPCGTSRMPSSA